MSTLTLEDVGASTPGEPLRLRFNSGGATDIVFEVDSSGVLQILADGEEIILGAVGFPTGADLTRVEGQLGVNSTTFAGAFQVVGSSGSFVMRFFNNGSAGTEQGFVFDFPNATPNSSIFFFAEYMDSTNTKFELRTNGGFANFQSNDADLSDADLKDVAPGVIPSTWDRIKALDIVSYRYKTDDPNGRPMIGVTAQQVRTVEPDWFEDRTTITYPEEKIMSRDGKRVKGIQPERIRERPCMVYNKDILFSAVRALQEAMTRIEALEAP